MELDKCGKVSDHIFLKWWETGVFSLCPSLLFTLLFCCSFLLMPLLCTGMGYPRATPPRGLYLLCSRARPAALALVSLPLRLHSRFLLLHFLKFCFFPTEAPHTLLMVPKERSICLSEAEGHEEEPILSILCGNTTHEPTVAVPENQ